MWLLVLVGFPGRAPGRERHRSLIRRSSKSWQVGMIVSIESDQTTRTRSSRCGREMGVSNHGLIMSFSENKAHPAGRPKDQERQPKTRGESKEIALTK